MNNLDFQIMLACLLMIVKMITEQSHICHSNIQ